MKHLCLINGWGMNRKVWPSCLAALESIAVMRFIDPTGDGKTPDAGQTFIEAAQSLADTLPPGAVLWGWSLGALLAMQAVLLSPQRIGGLILIGGTPCFIQRDGWTAAQPAALLRDFTTAVTADSRAALQRFAALFNRGDVKARPITREICRAILSSPLPASAALLAGLDWLRDTDLRGRVSALACPALLIHGERDPLMPPEAARWLAEKLPQARLEMFPDAAHAPFLNDPGRFARLIGDFLHDSRC